MGHKEYSYGHRKEKGHFIAQKENIGKTFPKSDLSKMRKHFCSNLFSITVIKH